MVSSLEDIVVVAVGLCLGWYESLWLFMFVGEGRIYSGDRSCVVVCEVTGWVEYV